MSEDIGFISDNELEFNKLMEAKEKGKTDGNGPADVTYEDVRAFEHEQNVKRGF